MRVLAHSGTRTRASRYAASAAPCVEPGDRAARRRAAGRPSAAGSRSRVSTVFALPTSGSAARWRGGVDGPGALAGSIALSSSTTTGAIAQRGGGDQSRRRFRPAQATAGSPAAECETRSDARCGSAAIDAALTPTAATRGFVPIVEEAARLDRSRPPLPAGRRGRSWCGVYLATDRDGSRASIRGFYDKRDRGKRSHRQPLARASTPTSAILIDPGRPMMGGAGVVPRLCPDPRVRHGLCQCRRGPGTASPSRSTSMSPRLGS